MKRRSEIENLVKVKTALAEKYASLATVRRSKPWRERLWRHAETYRQQAITLAEQLRRR